MHRFEVPVVVVFTKHDQFIRNVTIHLSDFPEEYPGSNVYEVAEKPFQEYYVLPCYQTTRELLLHGYDSR